MKIREDRIGRNVRLTRSRVVTLGAKSAAQLSNGRRVHACVIPFAYGICILSAAA